MSTASQGDGRPPRLRTKPAADSTTPGGARYEQRAQRSGPACCGGTSDTRRQSTRSPSLRDRARVGFVDTVGASESHQTQLHGSGMWLARQPTIASCNTDHSFPTPRTWSQTARHTRLVGGDDEMLGADKQVARPFQTGVLLLVGLRPCETKTSTKTLASVHTRLRRDRVCTPVSVSGSLMVHAQYLTQRRSDQ